MRFPFDKQRQVFRAIVCTVVPEAHELDADGWASLEAVVARGLEHKPRRILLQLRVFLQFVEQLARFRYGGRAFSSLTPAQRTVFCTRLEKSRVFLLRKGFWGVRTIALMGYYARSRAAGEIGYRAHPQGWHARNVEARV